MENEQTSESEVMMAGRSPQASEVLVKLRYPAVLLLVISATAGCGALEVSEEIACNMVDVSDIEDATDLGFIRARDASRNGPEWSRCVFLDRETAGGVTIAVAIDDPSVGDGETDLPSEGQRWSWHAEADDLSGVLLTRDRGRLLSVAVRFRSEATAVTPREAEAWALAIGEKALDASQGWAPAD